ncbi:hypothetical protein GZH46_00642 [Fragariocoptes setiger]|uniref:Uncharacterized protein n=1 Tax=Fragariocoptes setiger TaxID=1670756 RepID=A0ABQ7SBJ8_9ACAR|nr:hypothetical protein GZH46_00642 [Fragariocoptes setiger]
MYKFIVLLVACVVSSALAQPLSPIEPPSRPIPYAFSYSADSLGGRAGHSEQGFGDGRVQGFYTILGADGRERRVEYIADENGYRATIQSNEVGTKQADSADAQWLVAPPTEGQMAQANAYAQRTRIA